MSNVAPKATKTRLLRKLCNALLSHEVIDTPFFYCLHFSIIFYRVAFATGRIFTISRRTYKHVGTIKCFPAKQTTETYLGDLITTGIRITRCLPQYNALVFPVDKLRLNRNCIRDKHTFHTGVGLTHRYMILQVVVASRLASLPGELPLNSVR